MSKIYLTPSTFPKEFVIEQLKAVELQIKKEYDNFGKCPQRLFNRLEGWKEELQRIVFFENRK